MNKEEFIKRTGFEPTDEEYKEIEREYMGTSMDKDTFCSKWKRNDGINRLMRIRARRIEELESELRMKENEFNARMDDLSMKIKSLNRDLERAQGEKDRLRDEKHSEMQRADAAEASLATIRMAFEVLFPKGEDGSYAF